jgi:hypothetical protein
LALCPSQNSPTDSAKEAFFKTQRGAHVGDLFMSLIHTCILAHANPFEYLTALQLHSAEVRQDPHLWLPWNYTERLAQSSP